MEPILENVGSSVHVFPVLRLTVEPDIENKAFKLLSGFLFLIIGRKIDEQYSRTYLKRLLKMKHLRQVVSECRLDVTRNAPNGAFRVTSYLF